MVTLHRITTGKNGRVRITFEMPATEHYDALYFVSWSDSQDETAYRMERTGDEKWTVTLELEPGSNCQYRFCTPDGKSLQDSAPAPAQFGLHNSFPVSSDYRA
ncbi:MAG TPA: hypothetical protein VF784_04405 [Anaerolineales bacterium]